MGINSSQRGGAGAGRGDDPHGVTGESRLTGATASYLGGEGNTHFFSAEATGGGKTDSYALTLNPEHSTAGLRKGGVYHINMETGPNGFHPTPIPAHPDQKPGLAERSR